MSRIDELTLKLADGTLTPAEAGELESLLRDPAARRAHVAMLELVASLRGTTPAPGLRDAVVQRIQEEISGGIKKNVLEQIRKMPRPTRRVGTPSRPGWMAWGLAGVAAAALVTVIVMAQPAPEPKPPVGLRPPPAPTPVPPMPAPPEMKPVPEVKPAPLPLPATVPPPEPPKPLPEPRPVPEPPKPAPPPEPKPAPVPPPVEPAPRTTVAAVARVAEAQGEVFHVIEAKRSAAAAGLEILPGQGIATGEKRGSRAVVLLADGTRLELGFRSEIADIAEKRVRLDSGTLEARVGKQAENAPVLIRTPHAEARILGTSLRLTVDPVAGTTLLDVAEGKVRLTRLSDNRSIDVAAGQTAVASAGVEPTRLPPIGLAGHWRLDEKDGALASDASGRLRHGALVGDAKREPGRLGGSVRFGAAGYLQVQEFDVPERFTVTFWAFHPALSKDQDWYVNFAGVFHLMREGNMDARQIRMGFGDAPQEFLHASSAVPPNQWVHIAATLDATEMRLYVNGASSGAKKLAAPRPVAKIGATFGRMGPGGDGWMDDVRVYDRVLSPAEIRLVMAGGLALPAGKK